MNITNFLRNILIMKHLDGKDFRPTTYKEEFAILRHCPELFAC